MAIGKEGQNARLAARLTGYKIDIKSETQAKDAPGFRYEDYLDDEYDEDEDYIEEYEDGEDGYAGTYEGQGEYAESDEEDTAYAGEQDSDGSAVAYEDSEYAGDSGQLE